MTDVNTEKGARQVPNDQELLRLISLGGPTTFAGRAAARFCERYPDLKTVGYRPSMPELWSELISHGIDGIVLSGDSTGAGPSDSVRRLLRAEGLYIAHELLLPYHCSLFGNVGARLDDIDTVLGHGSVDQCRKFLRSRLPGADIRILHDRSSHAAAEMVAEGGKNLAVVGTPGAGERVGLVELASDIDQGAVGLWWVITHRARFDDRPQRLILRGRPRRTHGASELADLVEGLGGIGYRLDTVYSSPSGEELFLYDYFVALTGSPQPVAAVRDRLGAFPSFSLVAALPPLEPVEPAASAS